MVPLSFTGETFVASAAGALFWQARNALLVADLHLEKASWFARLGQLLPPYDSHATLTALAAEVKATGATSLYCLGDSFHDRFGCDRLPADSRALLTDLTASLDWTWIVGNHDPGFSDHCGGTIVEEAEVAGILLRHEARPGESRPLRGSLRASLSFRQRQTRYSVFEPATRNPQYEGVFKPAALRRLRHRISRADDRLVQL